MAVKTFKNRFLLIFSVSLILWACRRDQHPIPEVFVDIYVSLNIPSSLPLQNPGGAIHHEGGYKGLIIYRRFLSNRSDDFAVFDRACPVHWDQSCGRVSINEDMMYGSCACDSAQYLLYDGSAIGDNESVPLKFYRVRYHGNSLHIFN